jgi:hypothetical protein
MFQNIFNAVSGFSLAKKQKRMADKIQLNEADRIYNTSPFAKQMLGNAQMQKNAQMPGLDIAMGQMSQNQANAINAFQRGAGSGSAFLAAAAASQGQMNKDALGLSQQQAQFQQQQNANMNNALGVMMNEGDKEFQSKLNRYTQDAQVKSSLINSSLQNKANAWGNIGGFMDSAVQVGMQFLPGGQFAKKPGGGGGGAMRGMQGGGASGMDMSMLNSASGFQAPVGFNPRPMNSFRPIQFNNAAPSMFNGFGMNNPLSFNWPR